MDKIPTEDSEQMRFVQWFRRNNPGVRIFAIPNGGHRNKATAGGLKATGVTAGVPDLFIPAWLTWIEMKRRKGGRLSPEQKDWMTYLDGAGHTCIVAHGCDDAIEKLTATR